MQATRRVQVSVRVIAVRGTLGDALDPEAEAGTGDEAVACTTRAP